MCLPMQRYKFESNSQQFMVSIIRFSVVFTYAKIQVWKQFTTVGCLDIAIISCVYLCKDTSLKAIHNDDAINDITIPVVFTYAKIQVWKQFTTPFL